MKKSFIKFLTIVVLGTATGCKKSLEEYNPGGRTAETYYNTPAGFEDLAKSNYPNLRVIVNTPNLYYLGTDAFSTPNITDQSGLNLYNNNLNSLNTDIDTYSKALYAAINVANNTIYWATKVEGGTAATINIRVAEAKALRAYYYYLLVETFGDMPLVLTASTSVTLTYTRTPEKDIYTQIIQDLNDAIAVLPVTTADFGRVTKGCAQHLLSKVYLTRGYKSYGDGNADFQLAASNADSVIAGPYALKATYSDLFDPTVTNFQVNSEVIFSVQYSTNTTTNTTGAITGSTLYQYFLWDTQATGQLGRSIFYGRANNLVALDPYYINVFDRTRDSRYLASMYDVIYTQVAGSGFAVGDTLIYYPAIPFTAAEKAAKKYYVINPDEYRTSPFLAGVRSYPQFKKFRDPFVTSYTDGGGARDTYVFRLAETYLMAAEAYLKLGNTAKALEYFNAIRTRAAKKGNNPATGIAYSTEMQVSTLTIDDILDERLRELTGEEFRWFELKRTGTLLTRTLADNDEAKAVNTMKSFHTLRPIPQALIDLNQGTFPQNTGY
ncbi:Starch-binding associating with outer membrane [Chitinophaga sp. YR573]|uniref:RagB/SusD family nutrient uptake outer membrane protein n=1 Tax=Chitinophaga sp. YR573 TaxID=1881040 RepID=UPI0008C07B51|nr:RagB/SusD family nutrient uptake outer membrane protein [Chitinophaga sp. YR573]SEW25300.1 Starch-binding associating with outer membrane [Chitinophaga sp. YR573]